jgi:hypothetical protein
VEWHCHQYGCRSEKQSESDPSPHRLPRFGVFAWGAYLDRRTVGDRRLFDPIRRSRDGRGVRGFVQRRCYVAQFALFDNAFMRFSRTFDSILILPLITRQSPRNLIAPGRAGISRGSPVIDHLANLERVVWHGILLAANAFRDDRLRPRSNPFGKKAVTQKARAVKHDDPH